MSALPPEQGSGPDGQHTPAAAGPANPQPIVERKIKPDGLVREYPCELVYRDRSVTVIRFRMLQGGVIFGTPIEVPPGSVSDGWFWPRRPYNLYRMRFADGSILAHRFDAVADVRISDGAVEYRDLVLDWWVTKDDTIIEEDRDELEELIAAGKLGARDVELANEAARHVLSRYRHIIDDVARFERRFRG